MEQALHGKVDVNDFVGLKESLQKKLDIVVFLQEQASISDTIHKLDKDLQGIITAKIV